MIPKIFHRIWFGDRPRPVRYDDYWKQWQELHPDAQFVTWSEDNMPILTNQAVYDSIAQTARSGVAMDHERAVAVQRADVVAYELIEQYGGVYLNCDVAPLRPVTDLMESQTAFLGMEDDYFVCNAVMAGTQGHPLFANAVDRLTPWFQQHWQSGMEQATGPRYLTHLWRTGDYDVSVLPTSAFYPVHHGEIPYGTDSFDQYLEIGRQKGAYAVHMWGHRFQEGNLGR